MEGHPVPKNISEFEFHLVGDMTLKQFMYLAGGLSTAYVLFVTISSTAPLLAWPLIIVSALLGIAFAFLPIADRPLDHWAATYFKAIMSPTQRIIDNTVFENNPNFLENRLPTYLLSIGVEFPIQPQPKPATIASFIPSSTPPPSPPQPRKQEEQPAPKVSWVDMPSDEDLYHTVELARKAQDVKGKIVQTEQALGQIKAKAATPGVKPEDFSEEFRTVLSTLQGLNEQASSISKQLALLSKTPPPRLRTKVKIIPKEIKEQQKQIILTSTPNIINGVVTDSQGNYLDGVIVVTHDRQGLPVRALKSNKLGQFIAATPLANGIYTITLEKEGLGFDVLEIELDGKILLPIRVAAKKGIA